MFQTLVIICICLFAGTSEPVDSSFNHNFFSLTAIVSNNTVLEKFEEVPTVFPRETRFQEDSFAFCKKLISLDGPLPEIEPPDKY